MVNLDFYSKINTELEKILRENSDNSALHKHKDENKNKSYALLMWFLNFYGQTQSYSKYITEGKGDNSCDIILDVEDVEKGKIFYVVQSKWNNEKNCSKLIDSTEFKSALDDFKLILLGEKKSSGNSDFNRKYKQLLKHAEENGQIKFIYLSLANFNSEVEDNIESFEKNYNTEVQVLDINRIKRDYIDFYYKKIIPNNPLESYYTPDEEIKLNIEQLGIRKNYLKIERPFDAYIFLIRPKTIYELFHKYKFKLFFKNVRNPLLSSKVNENIEETLKNEIPYFWYFNNGITALTTYVDEGINPTAKSINITGLQIINGAQTVYSVYKSYKNASIKDRKIMDKEAFLTMRLLRVNSEKLGLKITKYTNSQNPMEERDFWANDDIQVKLQQESFNTHYWYEKRRGEFRGAPKGIEIVPNEIFAIHHLAINLQKPNEACKALKERKDAFFLSRQDDKDGLYEEIFVENNISFHSMLSAMLLAKTVQPFVLDNFEVFPDTNFLQTVTLSKILLKKFINWKFKSDSVNVNKFILDNCEKKSELFGAVAYYTNRVTYEYLGFGENESGDFVNREKFSNFLHNSTKFELVKEHFEELQISEDIGQEIDGLALDIIREKEIDEEE
jgi:hypothetical protein